MKSKFLWLVMSILLVLSLVLVSCGTKTSPTTTQSTTTISTTKPTTTQTTASTTKVTTTTGNWWDKFGTPEYGGTFIYQTNRDVDHFDPYWGAGPLGLPGISLETLAGENNGLNPETWDFNLAYTPFKYWVGRLAENWETSDYLTYVFHIRKGVYWQDVPPVNGREMTAYDIEWNWHRILGLGSGFTEPSAYVSAQANYGLIESVTATDKYTVVFKVTEPSLDQLRLIVEDQGYGYIVPREAVETWGDVDDWRHVIGTGPFIITDYTSGSSITANKNSKYWGYDEIYPDNRLPYVDKVKILIIPELSTALAALRTGKIDMVENVDWQRAKGIINTNPELLQVTRQGIGGPSIGMMVDKKPFDDIRVRTAMQMAIDLKTIAQTYYGGIVDGTPIGLVGIKGYYTPFNEWPQSLKDEYTYNPTGAKKLLTEAGYPNGFKCTQTTRADYDITLYEILKAYLLEIGIDMEIQIMDSVTYSAYTRAGKHEMCSQSFTAMTIPPLNIISRFYTGHATNATHHVNDPKYDAFWVGIKNSFGDEETVSLTIEADMYASTQHWVVHTVPSIVYCIYQPYLKRFYGQSFAVYSYGQWFARFWKTNP